METTQMGSLNSLVRGIKNHQGNQPILPSIITVYGMSGVCLRAHQVIIMSV